MKRFVSEKTIERTLKVICRFWATALEGDFHPDSLPRGLTPPLAERFDIDMQYLWLNSPDPFGLAVEANLFANPRAYGAFDSCPRAAD